MDLFKQLDVTCLESDIIIDSAVNRFTFESGMTLLMDASMYLEAGDSDKDDSTTSNHATSNKKSLFAGLHEKFMNTVHTICEAIRHIIDSFMDVISNSSKADMSDDEYLSSHSMKKQTAYDTAKIEEKVKDELRKSNKLIQAIASSTGVSDKTIDTFLRESSAQVDNMLTEQKITNFVSRRVSKGILKTCKDGRSLIDLAENLAKKIKDPKKQKQALKILGHMNNLTKKFTRLRKSVAETRSRPIIEQLGDE